MMLSFFRVMTVSLFFTFICGMFLAITRHQFDWPPGGIKDFLWVMAAGVSPFTLLAVLSEYRRHKRIAAIRQLATHMSLPFCEKVDDETADQIGKLLAGRIVKIIGLSNRDFELKNVLQGVREGVRVLIGDLGTEIDQGERRKTIKQTIIQLSGEHLCFSQFGLEPEPQKRSFLDRFAGQTPAASMDQRSFAESYYLHSSEPEVTERLFSLELQKYLTQHWGWEIRAEQDSILFARNRAEPVVEWESLLDECLHILSLLNQAVDQLVASPPPVDGRLHEKSASNKVVVRQERLLPSGTGPFARFIMAMLLNMVFSHKITPVTRDEVDAFFQITPPRVVPDRIANQSIRSQIPRVLMLLAIGVPSALFGGLTMALGIFFRDHLAGLVSCVVGAVLLTLAATCLKKVIDAYQRHELLRKGLLAGAKVINVQSGSPSKGSYQADIEYQASNQHRNLTVTLTQPDAEFAREHAENGKQVPLLYDPRKPARCLLAWQLQSPQDPSAEVSRPEHTG